LTLNFIYYLDINSEDFVILNQSLKPPRRSVMVRYGVLPVSWNSILFHCFEPILYLEALFVFPLKYVPPLSFDIPICHKSISYLP